MPVLDHTSPIPLYYQLKDELRRFILTGHLEPHAAIPSEPELVATYHVSRATVRQALNELVQEGLLYREHGKGTFVREPHFEQAVSELTSLSDTLKQRGQKPGGIFLASELTRGDQNVRDQLKVAEEEQVMRLERVRTADGMPCAHEVAYLPYPRASRIYQHAKEVAEGSLYLRMRAEGLIPFIMEQSIRGGVARSREAMVLQVAEGEAGLRLVCTTYDSTGSPIGYSESFFPSDRFDFRSTLRVARSF
jgi:GntR family transcriptional regulator